MMVVKVVFSCSKVTHLCYKTPSGTLIYHETTPTDTSPYIKHIDDFRAYLFSLNLPLHSGCLLSLC